MSIDYSFDWADLAFASKKPLKDLNAIFIAAPREMSQVRFKQLVKEYLPKGNIILGVAKEGYIDGFEGQPQFLMLNLKDVQHIIDQVNKKTGKIYRIYTLEYFQRELPYILEKISFSSVVFVNGSWKHLFHSSPAYYILSTKKVPYKMISPFVDEQEAKEYGEKKADEIVRLLDMKTFFRGEYTELELMDIAKKSATRSFDYGFQTGLSLAIPIPNKRGKYKLIISTYNKVVPFPAYALHYGALREKYFSATNDLNYYDTVHAEVNMLMEYVRYLEKTPRSSLIIDDLSNAIMFINLMPCPACARMLSQTDIKEFVYSLDHSDGYALKLLEQSGKKIRRLVI